MRPTIVCALALIALAACGARTGLDHEEPAAAAMRDARPPGRDAGLDAGRDAGRDAGSPMRPDASLDAAVPPNLEAALQVSSGLWHSCAATRVGRVHCWGFNNRGQIGDGSAGNARLPVVSAGIATARGLATGQAHSCAALEDGSVMCWGANESGQLGTGVESLREILPTRVEGAANVARVAAGGSHTCALSRTGAVTCWGFYDGVGSNTPGTYPEPRAVPLDAPALEVATGLHHSCALLEGGRVMCWAGYELHEDTLSLPAGRNMHEVALPRAAADISAGDEGSCAALQNGEVYCWGFVPAPDSVALSVETPTPAVPVAGLTDVVQVTTGHEFSCALRGDRTVRCWGNNRRGQLGDGGDDQTPEAAVTPIGLPPIDGVSAGWRHACALDFQGAVWCWGRDWENQLGDGEGGESRLPTVAIVVQN